MIHYRTATDSDVKHICQFTDYWLAGRGFSKKAPGAVNDYFISPSQHLKYVTKYTTWLAFYGGTILAWAVMEPSGTLIHMLVAGDMRGLGIGGIMLTRMNPRIIRSKMDQTTGDPSGYYLERGYEHLAYDHSRPILHKQKSKRKTPCNINILQRKP